MMTVLITLAATASVSPAAPGIDARLAAGLVVTIDRISEPMSVDGVLMNVQRVSGTGVPELARRIEDSWRRQGSQVQVQQMDAWSIRSRFQGPRSEVMQWRRTDSTAELLLSVLDTQAPVRSAPTGDLVLPAVCAWGRSVSGRGGGKAFVQRSARCRLSVQALSLQMSRSVPAQGWNVLVATESGMQLNRPGAEGFIGLAAQQGDAMTWLTWLRVEDIR